MAHRHGQGLWFALLAHVQAGPRARGNVRKGEHGAKVCYFDRITREAVDQNTGETTAQQIPFVKTYTVFSAEQCDGLPAHFTAVPAPVATPAFEEARLAHAEAFIAHTGAEIRYGGDRACYAIAADLISMPPFSAFADPHDFYSTELHELVHWTRHEKRLNRDCCSATTKIRVQRQLAIHLMVERPRSERASDKPEAAVGGGLKGQACQMIAQMGS